MAEKLELSCKELVEGLAEQRKNREFCDVILEAEGQQFSVHRNVVAAASPYFKAMFSGKFAESNAELVKLEGVTHIGLKILIDCVYSSQLTVSQENIISVVNAAAILQFNSVMKLCETFLKGNITETNCLQLLKLCETHNLEAAREAVVAFFMEKFTSVSQNSEFLEISKDSLVRYLSDTNLHLIGSEIDVYRRLMRWIRHEQSRSAYAEELVQHIRFHHIPIEFITDELLKEPLLIQNPQCEKLLHSAIKYHTSVFEQPVMQVSPPRGKPGIFVTPMATNETDKVSSASLVSFSSTERMSTSPCPNPALFCPEAHRTKTPTVVIGNFIYIFTQINAARYDVTMNKWITIGSVPRRNICHGFADTAEGKILHGGGKDSNGDIVDDCSVYDIASNTWGSATNMPEKMYGALTCSYGPLIYVTAGWRWEVEGQIDTFKDMWAYDTKGDVWLRKANLLKPHGCGMFEVVGDEIYIAGGSYMLPHAYGIYEEEPTARSMEVYNINTDQWTDITSAHPGLDISPMIQYGKIYSFASDGCIYLLGVKVTDKGPITVDAGTKIIIFDVTTKEVKEEKIPWVFPDAISALVPVVLPNNC